MADYQGTVCSVWLRRPLNEETSNPPFSATEQDVHFVRHQATGRTNIDYIGVDDSFEHHRYKKAQENWKNNLERTILVNCLKHYADLADHFPQQFSSWNAESDAYDADGSRRGENIMGEQLLVDGIDAESVCVGDIFGTDKSPLELHVQFPRLPCFRVDHRFPVGPPKPHSGHPGTVRQWVATNGRGGFFCSVKTPGDIGDGDKLRLVRRPHPEWNMDRLSYMCYGQTPLHITWKGSDAELQELCEMEDLGYHEWRERLLVVKASIVAERPLRLPPDFGKPVTREEGIDAIGGTWLIDGCAGFFINVKLTFEEGAVRSAEELFGGTHMTGLLQDGETEFTLDVEMGHFPMTATMNKRGGQVVLVFSSGSVWTKDS